MKLHTYTGGFVQTNGYLLEAPEGWLAIDAPADFTLFAKGHEIEVSHCLLTHQHFDHVEDASSFSELSAYAAMDRSLIMDERAREWGVPVSVPDFTVAHLLKDQPTLEAAGLKFELLHVPGHSPDSIAFYLPAEKMLFGGDALFQQGVGRTDLPGGDQDLLFSSIREKLYTLPDDITVYPGHGAPTTIGEEKIKNPFVRL